MAVFMVERDLAGISMGDLAAAQGAVIAHTDGTETRYLRTTFSPGDGRCFCLFEAGSAEAVKAANEAVGVPYTRVVEVLDLPRPG